MKARANKKDQMIDIIDDKTKTMYKITNCTEEDLNTCDLWTDEDCKSWLRAQGGCLIKNI